MFINKKTKEEKTYEEVKQLFPGISFPVKEPYKIHEWYRIEEDKIPEYDKLKNVLSSKIVKKKNKFYRKWIITDTTDETLLKRYYSKEKKLSIKNIEVQYKGNTYQGDEVSQERLSRAIIVMNTDETIEWVTKDNTITTLSREDLQNILREAFQNQSAIIKTYINNIK